MKKTLVHLILLVYVLLGVQVYAQIPKAAHADYSTKTGTYTDTRDGKTYAYKKYGSSEWFMQNLSYEKEFVTGDVTIKGIYSPNDPEGKLYGMQYPSAPENTNEAQTENLCPEGWSAASFNDYVSLFNIIAKEYEIVDEGFGQSSNTFNGISKYLRAGGVQGVDADGLWHEGTIIDPKSAAIGFNALPGGTFNTTTNEYKPGEDQPGNKSNFLTGGTNHLMIYRDNEAAANWNRTADFVCPIRCFRPHFPDGEITTPYPTTIDLDQINSADKELIRLAQNLKKSDHQPTGFYLEKGKKLVLNVDMTQSSTDGQKPQVVVGTMGQIDNDHKIFELNAGTNTIAAAQHNGGLIYLRFVTDADNDPQGKAKITFTPESEQIRAPHYVYGVTTDEEFGVMMGKYQTPEVVFHSDYSLVVARRHNAISISMEEDKKKWMDILHTVLEREDEVSGLDNSDANPLHHRLKAGEVRYMYIETSSLSPHATQGYTAYPIASPRNYLSYKTIFDESWMMGHEVGHQHQQGAYQVDRSTESTVNIYSYVTERYMQSLKGNNDYNRTSTENWLGAQTKYLTLPMEQRIYNMDDEELENIVGFNRDVLRFMPWEQLFIMFGDDFYKTLHRVVREEKRGTALSEQEKREYLAWKSSEITGYDLSGFFNEWGIQITEPYYKKILADKISNSAFITAMPADDKTLTHITGQNRPAWAPLVMKGISSSQPETGDDQPADRQASKDKYCDYSSQSGLFVDSRDQKEYPYKKYGRYDWFMTNLSWDGFDGTDPSTKGTVGYYGADDADGKVYGRMYPTNPAYIGIDITKWCPEGWRVASTSNFDQLLKDIQAEYKLTESKDAIKCMKCGGDRDVVADGLWSKGAADLNTEMAALVGINFLPAGVFNDVANNYESGDKEGRKAAFVNEGWYHDIYSAMSNEKEYINRMPWHNGSVRCIRPSASMAEQTITFDPLEDVKLATPDFEPGATINSDLPITYTSSNINVATVVDGKIHLINVGTTTITASQDGDSKHHPAVAKQQKMKVVASDILLDDILLTINGKTEWKSGDTYSVPCDTEIKEVEVYVNVQQGVEVLPSNPFIVNVNSPSIATAKFRLKSGNTIEEGNINIEKRFAFDDVVHTKWGDTHIVKNNPKYNGGFTFTKYTWFKDNKAVHEGQSYVTDNAGSSLYTLQLVTNTGKTMNTCPGELKNKGANLKVYPTMIVAGEPVYIDASDMPEEFFEKSSVTVVSMIGNTSQPEKIKEEVTSLRIPSTQGVYLIKVKSDSYQKTFKVIVK